ncbi:hypothetical protein [Cereibacter sphaeroides]|uniref:hypothetical protein n=1 Tax=Cereibacter sphaeroides TaxID=1063 RepID=UPI001F40B0EA|nr:hypothetical protein [Cereibacter sphaeroides]MCE6967563.1 hypothetical protein [Cereibacter sphaeroides]
MTTRREMVGGLALLAGAAGVAGQPAPARALESLRVALADLPELPAERSPVWVEGQGWFTAGPADRIKPDGVLRFQGPGGQHWRREEAPGVLRPHWFVEAADDGDDALAIQRALDFAASNGPFALDLGARRYMCRSRLILDPTRVALRGVGAVLDFSSMPAPQVLPPVVTIDTLWPDDNWNTEGKALLHEDGRRDLLSRPLSLPEDGRYRVSFAVSQLTGTGPSPFLKVMLAGLDGRHLGGTTVTAPGRYGFEVEGGESAAVLTLESDARLRLERLEVDWQGWRECILVRSSADSPQYGHKWIEGVEFAGPGKGTLLHGLRFETAAVGRSSRLDLRGVTVQGFHTGMVFSHRSYLVRGYGLRCLSEIGMHFLGGAEDAGELFSFYGSIIGGARIALLNQGAEIFLDGTSVNFVDQIMSGSGTLTMQGCHLEINRPQQPERPPFDVSSGTVTMNGGTFLVTGAGFDEGNQCDAIFRLRSRAATAIMRDVTVYNLRTRSGALADGPGRLDTERLRGSRPRHVAPIVQFDPARNLLGPLPIDSRTSDSRTGAFQHHPLDRNGFKAGPAYRFVWLCGLARPGYEVGAAFRIRGNRPGRIIARLEALRGERRTALGSDWTVEISSEWTKFSASTMDTHPSAAMDGRIPEGWEQVAIMFDMSGYEDAVEVQDIFLSAI